MYVRGGGRGGTEWGGQSGGGVNALVEILKKVQWPRQMLQHHCKLDEGPGEGSKIRMIMVDMAP